MAKYSCGGVVLAFLCITGLACAQGQPAASAPSIIQALERRAEIVRAVASGAQVPEAAVAQLKAGAGNHSLHPVPAGDAALALQEVGRRLVTMGHAEKAAVFFQTAATDLEEALQAGAGLTVASRATLHLALAELYSRDLNLQSRAHENYKVALALQPEDAQVKRRYKVWANSHAEIVKGEVQP